MFPVAELRIALGSLSRCLRQSAVEQGITDSQLAVLFSLTFEGPSPLGLLASRLEVTPASMSYTINALEVTGWVARRRGDDPRRREIYLTEAGVGRVTSLIEDRDRLLAIKVGALSDLERARLRDAVPILSALAAL